MTYVYGGIAAFLCALFFWLGGLHSKAALEGFQAAQTENTAKAVLAERASTAAELARVNALLKGYQDEALKPVDATIAERVLYHACPAVSAVPSPGAHASGTLSPSPQPRSDPETERLLQAVFTACSADAEELTTLQQAWPR